MGLLIACDSTNNKPLSIGFSSDSTKIIIKDINEAGLYQQKSNLKTDTVYQKIVSVLQTPGDDDTTSMEIDWPGKLAIVGDSLIFSPVKPFVKGRFYLVQTVINAQFAKSEEIIKTDVGHYVKPQQQLLRKD